jgi:hypothetical protein
VYGHIAIFDPKTKNVKKNLIVFIVFIGLVVGPALIQASTHTHTMRSTPAVQISLRQFSAS